MFDSLSDRLGGIFERLGKRGALSESDVESVLREVRIALLEADVALPVAKQFIADVKPRAIGQEVLRSVKPDQQVIKVVHDTLVETLGEATEGLTLAAEPPVPVLMVGLQGSGKTTSTGKIAKLLTEKDKKKVIMASLDTRRPAAQEQLRFIGEQLNIDTLPILEGQEPVA
ncbi:MAG: signal recognition particle receptor subunit alpha, partial [Pseudomonadota bacterium]